MASKFSGSVSDYSTSAGPSKPKRASESELVNWKNVGDEVDEGDFIASYEVTKDDLNFTKPQIQSKLIVLYESIVMLIKL